VSAARRLVIAGGGPAALAAARGYRDTDGDGDVVLVTPELSVPYRRPPLSKDYLRGALDESELPIEPEAWYAEHDVEVRLGDAAARLDPETRTVALAGGGLLRYDACVLATGAAPARLPVAGAEHRRIRVLRSLAEARALRERAETAERAVVVGSGFIGCEAAASLSMRGVAVTLVSDEDIPHATRLGEEAGRRIQGWLEEHRVQLELGHGVDAIERGVTVRTPATTLPDADLVLMASGVTPRGELAAAAGLATHAGRIVVDERMRASADGVLAAGDVAWARNAAAGRHLAVEHWGDALAMGEVAGRTAAGADATWAEAPGFWSTIGTRTLKYAAWGDGYDEARFAQRPAGGWSVWYGRDGVTVGVLAHDADEDYEHGRELVESGAPLP
jgi:NADPH-dependent 2,4-dienoyl-CoA reductase/sulfur reductase-like enzyme